MKNQWNQFPFVLRRKILLTFLAGLASIALSLIIFIITTDHILLVLGSIIFLASLVLVRSLWSTIARGQYEIVEGVCSSVVSPMMRQYRKIQLIDEQGAERTLLLSKSAKFQIGARYRFYFQSSSHPTVGNDYLDAALSTNSFLGYEALGEPAVQEEQAKETGETYGKIGKGYGAGYITTASYLFFLLLYPLFLQSLICCRKTGDFSYLIGRI